MNIFNSSQNKKSKNYPVNVFAFESLSNLVDKSRKADGTLHEYSTTIK